MEKEMDGRLENTEAQGHGDLHRALTMAVVAILVANGAAQARLTTDQNAEIRRRLGDKSARLVLLVSTDGIQAHAELTLVAAEAVARVFDGALLRLDGLVAAAMAEPEAVQVADRGAMH